jgi:hypothetical protein
MHTEYDHFTIDEIRQKLEDIHYYGCHPADRTIFINWIKGHSGNKLHECAERHAARVAFRSAIERNRTPEGSKYRLYFYECLITGDVRQHNTSSKYVRQSILRSGEVTSHKSQGKLGTHKLRYPYPRQLIVWGQEDKCMLQREHSHMIRP